MTEPESLLAALTVDEKLRLLHQQAPALPALGLPAYHTGCEALHGVAWNGVATVFPQAVGLASAWNDGLLTEIGHAVALELHAMRAENPALGLNVWAPVVNPLRNPRWGRNEEGYSEDPTLTSRSAIAYTRGLRGDGATWLTAPTLKHFVGYNNEDDRDLTSSSLSARTFREYELPCFLGPLEAGGVAAVMASYNFVNGIPAHVSPMLDELRAELADPDDLAIVSDAGAPSNLWKREGWSPDAAHGVASVLAAGVDNLTDDNADWRPSVEALRRALDDGLITLEQVDRAVRRLLRLRAKTGDLVVPAPYAGPSAGELRERHRALALRAATESIVLLENRGGALPLAPGAELAVVGPLGQRVLTDWYSGSLPYAVTIADALAEWAPGARLARGVDRVTLKADGGFLAAEASGALTLAGSAEDAAEFELERWGSDVVTLRLATSGRFVTVGEDGAPSASAEAIGGWFVQESFVLVPDGPGAVRLRHRVSEKWLGVVDGRPALVEESDHAWSLDVVVSGVAEAARAAAGRTAVVVVGNDPHVLGRETEDRPSVELPEAARELVEAAAGTAERIVLVIVSSYPYALGSLPERVDAVVWTSHGGQELGTAVRAVLTGAAEPRGRLTQSWPASGADVHELLDYDIVGSRQTYLYSTTPAAYPFGHGLHYSTTELTDAAVSAASVAAGPLPRASLDEPVAVVTATVRNTGARPVAELVQLYVGAGDEPRRPFPRRRLVDWRRVPLKPGEAAAVSFELPARSLAQWDQRAGGWHVEPGAYRVFLGRSAEDVPVSLELRAEGAAIAPLVAGTAHPVAAYDDASAAELVTDPADGGTAVRPRGARVTLRFVDVEAGPQGRVELRARSGAGDVEVVATAVASGARATAVVRAAEAEASAPLTGISAGELVDLELSWAGELALLSFRML